MNESQINIYDYDKNDLPEIKFDVVISLFSLDYHYDFHIYSDYLKKVMKKESILIFDTIRPKYFENIFEHVEILKEDLNTVHKSKRIACREFK